MKIYKYVYFIHYTFTEENSSGDGNLEIGLDSKIDSISKLLKVAKIIKRLNYDSVVVTNFILLRENSEIDI